MRNVQKITYASIRTATIMVLAGLLVSSYAIAQDQEYTVSGEVVDAATGESLPGVNVQVENTAFGAATGPQGLYNFTARLEPGTYTLVYSFVGYQRTEREVVFGDDADVEVPQVELEADVMRGDELVVTGVGIPTERRQLGQALASIDGSEIEASGATSIDQALSGKVPGAIVNQNSGRPDGGISVRLRGTATVLGSGEPLYIVDGVIVNNDSPELIDIGGGSQNRLSDLNPNDIERIEVVKGAAAAALYGSRANNGVVQIFTKRGQDGPPQVDFTTRVRSDNVRRTLDVNMAQNEQGEFIDNAGNIIDQRYDFQDFIFRRAYGTEQHLSISGGADRTSYSVSGGHLMNEGVVQGNDYRRLNARARMDHQLADWLRLSVGTQFSSSSTDEVPHGGMNATYGALTGFIFGPNTFDPRPDNGEYSAAGVLANPVDVIDRFDFEQTTERFVGDIQLNAALTENLSADYVLGYDTHEQVGTVYILPGNTAPGYTTGFTRRSERTVQQLNNDLNLRYQTDLNENVFSTTAIGGSIQYENSNSFSAQAQQLTPISEVVQSGTDAREFGESRAEQVIYGAYVQQTLGLLDRIFLTGATRVDAASVFGAGERWQLYPKVSLSYVLSDESFWQDSNFLQQWIPSFRLRTSLGESGGLTAIGPFTRFTNYSPQGFAGRTGLVPSSQLGALDVRPERQRELEVGADIGLLDDRLAAEITFYDQETYDLLLTRSLAPTSGFLSRLENVGNVRNRGLELSLRAIVLDQADINWISTVNYSTNRNRVDGLEEDRLIVAGSFGAVAVENDEPLGIYYASSFERDADGNIVDSYGNPLSRDDDGYLRLQNPDAAEGGGEGDPPPGIPASSGQSEKIGNPNPDFTASWINEVDFAGNFSFRAQFDAVIGQDVFNFTRRLGSFGFFGTLEDYQRELEGDLPTGYNAAVFNIFENWVEDGSYVKLREISLGYTITPEQLPLRNVRLRLTGRNLFSIDNYSGYDPEINVTGQSNLVRGFDFMEVPIPRSISLSVTLGL